MIEIGGTVGDIESLPFLEAIRQIGQRARPGAVHVRAPDAGALHPQRGELKTKPTQHSVKELQNVGIQPQMLLCRCDRAIPDATSAARSPASATCAREAVIAALGRGHDLRRADLAYHEQGMDREVLRHFGLPFGQDPAPTWPAGSASSTFVSAPEGEVRIAVVGKYTNLLDSYKSLSARR